MGACELWGPSVLAPPPPASSVPCTRPSPCLLLFPGGGQGAQCEFGVQFLVSGPISVEP